MPQRRCIPNYGIVATSTAQFPDVVDHKLFAQSRQYRAHEFNELRVVNIYKRGKIWYIAFEYKGKRYRKSLETRSKQIAELALKDVDVKMARDRFDLTPPEDILFEDFANKFLDLYAMQNAQKSYQDYRNLFTSTIIPYFS